MELNFALLVAAAVAGLVAKLVLGWNPQAVLALLTSLTLNVWLYVRLIDVAFVNDQLVVQEMTNVIVERLVSELASTIVGEVAGVYAATIFGVAKRWLSGW